MIEVRSATAGTAAASGGPACGASTATGSALIAQLEITFADGHRQVRRHATTTWSAGPSVTVENDLYDGQTIDPPA